MGGKPILVVQPIEWFIFYCCCGLLYWPDRIWGYPEGFDGGGEKELIKHVSKGYRTQSFVRSSSESRRHRNLILKLATAYDRAGFEVYADHVKGYDTPEKISMVLPDIVAVREDFKVVIEVETRNSEGSERDKRQRKIFGEWAKGFEDRDFRRETAH